MQEQDLQEQWDRILRHSISRCIDPKPNQDRVLCSKCLNNVGQVAGHVVCYLQIPKNE